MKIRSYKLVANWKMHFGTQQAREFVENLIKNLQFLHEKKEIDLVLCPSYDALSIVKESIGNTPILLGAQDCSAFKYGPYTGQVAATSLQQLGCRYGIVGHSETRTFYKQTNADIAQKTLRLLEVGITPIICIGETQAERETQKTDAVLDSQLLSIIEAVMNKPSTQELIIAYEPLWAIGTGITPTPEIITDIFENIMILIADSKLKNPVKLLYGGSVNSDTIEPLKTLQKCNGFLIGSASTDFQELKKIVDLL